LWNLLPVIRAPIVLTKNASVSGRGQAPVTQPGVVAQHLGGGLVHGNVAVPSPFAVADVQQAQLEINVAAVEGERFPDP
jgi:hypothetical protein